MACITARFLESRKHQRLLIMKINKKKEILRRQNEKEDYWDGYEDFSLDSRSEELDSNESSSDHPSFDEGEEELIGKNKRREDIREGLGDDEGEVQLEIEKCNFELKWRSNADGYF